MNAVAVPHSIEHEQSVLGGLLLSPDSIDRITMDRSEFYSAAHRTIFGTIQSILSEGGALDILTLAERMERDGTLEAAGGLEYIGALVQNTPTAVNIHHYAGAVQNKAIERRLMGAAEEIRMLALSTGDVKDKLSQAETLISAVMESMRSERQISPVKYVVEKAVVGLDERYNRGGEIMGLATGFADLDQKTCGLQRGDLIVVAGRPSMGKTAFALNIAENFAVDGGKGAFFSLEMGAISLVNRMLSGMGRIDSQRVRSGKLVDDDWNKLTYAVGKIMKMQLWIDETAAATPADIRSGARKASRAMGGLDFIVIDYLQLMATVTNRKNENRTTEISEISRALKALAKELDVPVIALSQLNRGLEQRQNKRPVMSDLRESGAIEQDADVILFVYRDEVYNEDSSDKGTAEIIIGKQRNGPIGTVRLTYMSEYTRFGSYGHPGHER